MLTSRWIRRRWVEKHLHEFLSSQSNLSQLKVLEIGSGKKWRYVKHSVTMNRDTDAEPDLIGDAENLDIHDEQFDLVLCLEVIEHTLRPEKIVSEMHRVLKPGGQVMLTAPFCLEIHDPLNDYHRFPKQGLEVLFHDFSSVTIQANGGLHSLIAHFLGQAPLGRFLYPLYNTVGWYADQWFTQTSPRATLGYTVIAKK